jgi:hypothetical protein
MPNKPLVALTPKQQHLIVRNVLSACKDITKLNGTGYNFLYLASGFIAHYSIHGFKDFYRIPGTLILDITRNASWNQWDNFRPGQEHYEYYMSKKAVYNAILAGLGLA